MPKAIQIAAEVILPAIVRNQIGADLAADNQTFLDQRRDHFLCHITSGEGRSANQ